MDPSVKLLKTVQPAAQDETADHVPVRTEVAGAGGPEAAARGGPDRTGPESLVGQSFGDFEVLAELGRGGMGAVYKARQKSLDRLVALKVLLAGPRTTPALRARFLAEAQVGAVLAHPNIPAFYQTGECPAGPYCAMEYIDGQSLDALIEGRIIAIPWAVALLFRVTGAVHHAHTKGIIHRDLKPGNILIDKAHRPVVMDFGLARVLEKPTGLTQEGDIVGTPTYMPPEQARGNLSQIGPPSDIYSLGAILYRLLAGRPPYVERTPLDTILKLLSPEPPPPLRNFRPEVPAELEQVCMKCLHKDPAQRYPTARALAVEVRRFRTPLPAAKPGPATMRPLPLQGSLLLAWTGEQVSLPGGPIVIGRTEGCDILLSALTVSERHCRILVDAQHSVIEAEDLGSAGGTLVNGRPVQRCRLQDGDRLDVGGFVFQVSLPGRKGPEQ
jgi:serine/threonine protein kinase